MIVAWVTSHFNMQAYHHKFDISQTYILESVYNNKHRTRVKLQVREDEFIKLRICMIFVNFSKLLSGTATPLWL
jgi:hypothetical protein